MTWLSSTMKNFKTSSHDINYAVLSAMDRGRHLYLADTVLLNQIWRGTARLQWHFLGCLCCISEWRTPLSPQHVICWCRTSPVESCAKGLDVNTINPSLFVMDLHLPPMTIQQSKPVILGNGGALEHGTSNSTARSCGTGFSRSVTCPRHMFLGRSV